MNKIYSIGLDIGTTSVGWAVVDEKNELLKFKNKNMWGTRLFEEASTAKDRRLYRGTRRRYERRRQRLFLLQQLIGDEVLKQDETFFIRLKESFLIPEEKSYAPQLLLDEILTNSNYYHQFPTIYHLRNHLMTEETKQDLRLIYLAFHHIIKYRGNFLFEGQDFNLDSNDIEQELKLVLDYFNDYTKTWSVIDILDTLKNNLLRKKDKQEELNKLLSLNDKESKEIIKNLTSAILGYQFSCSKLFHLEEEMKLDFSNFEEYNDEFMDADDKKIVFEKIYKIYSWIQLNQLLQTDNSNDNLSLSLAKINVYDVYKMDLKRLKKLFKQYAPEQYNYFFRQEYADKNKKLILKNYTNYIKRPSVCNLDDLKKTIEKILDSIPEIEKDEDYLYCKKKLEEKTFLKKINSKDNSLLPYQLNKKELIEIIDKQGKYYPTLKKEKDKIISLLEFKIPYYIGPLNSHSSFGWIEKLTHEKIYPWNFEQVVDIDTTAEKFIKRMLNQCTYLLSQDVLPKNSLLYSDYEVLNELNKIRVNDELLPPLTKKRIFEELFTKHKVIKYKTLESWLIKEGFYDKKSLKTIEGFQKEKEFASSRNSYIDFLKIFGKIDESNREQIENIILWLTLLPEKKIVKRYIENAYPELENEKINQILLLKYSGWGKFSKKLLTDTFSLRQTTIMDELIKTNMNFMQIIHDKKLGFEEIIKDENAFEKKIELNYEYLKSLQGSPALKRGIWQTFLIIKEIEKIMKCKPQKIMIEFARSEEEKERTVSRSKKIMALYDNFKEESFFDKSVYAHLKTIKNNISNRKVLLYFLQNGRCVYTGEPLSFEDLELYEIDHIVPQSYIKDDSIENIVLVKKLENQYKSDDLTISPEVRKKCSFFWNYLKKNQLMGNKKYFNLTRSFFTESQLEGFIARQLVETRQISKHIANLLHSYYNSDDSTTQVITIRANLVSDFRRQYKIPKIREMNDYHHANDAYLCCVLGNYIDLRFPKIKKQFQYGEFSTFVRNAKKSNTDKNGFVIGSIKYDYIADGEIIWSADREIKKIKNIMNYKDCFISKKLEEHTGKFYDETIYPKGEGLYPLKKHLSVKLYGGYKSEKMAYFSIIEYDKGKKRVKKLVGVPALESKFIRSREDLQKYFESTFSNVTLLKEKIMKYQLIEEDGKLLYIVSDKEVINGKQLLIDKKYLPIISRITKFKSNYWDDRDCQLMNEFYDDYLKKLKEQFPIFDNVRIKLVHAQEKFLQLSTEAKGDFIREMLKLTRANSGNPNFKRFTIKGLTEREGRKGGYNIDLEKTIFITHSVTGMFESRYQI